MRTNTSTRPGRSSDRPTPTTRALLVVSITILIALFAAAAAGATSHNRGRVATIGARYYEEVLAHDDGTAESSITGSMEQMLAVGFQAPVWATHVVGIEFYSADDGVTNPVDPQLPSTLPFMLCIWRPSEGNHPGESAAPPHVPFPEPYSYSEEAWVRADFLAGGIEITDDYLFPDRRFFVGLEWEARLSPYVGEDTNSPGPSSSWRWNWSTWELREGKAMIRAVVAVDSFCIPEVIHVDAAGGADYAAIQDAVDAASRCDTILVAPGTYSGPANRGISFGGKNIALIAPGGRAETIIDCEYQDRGFLFVDGEEGEATVQGFTVRNGLGSGAGIRCVNSWPTIVDCAFVDCDGENYGGGAYCNNAVSLSPTFTRCVFADNVAAVQGGGVLMDFSDATFENCTFAGNGAAEGGGIHCGIGSSPTFTRCIVALGAAGGAVNCPGTSVPTFTNCCVFGNAGGDELCGDHFDNLFSDPHFCGPDAGDYSLHENSPCLPANNEWWVLIGALGQGCSGTAVEEKSWGAIKALYR